MFFIPFRELIKSWTWLNPYFSLCLYLTLDGYFFPLKQVLMFFLYKCVISVKCVGLLKATVYKMNACKLKWPKNLAVQIGFLAYSSGKIFIIRRGKIMTFFVIHRLESQLDMNSMRHRTKHFLILNVVFIFLSIQCTNSMPLQLYLQCSCSSTV